jgi:hypothetical protein
MKRRNFILASTGIAGGAFSPYLRAAQPCPPPTVTVSGGTTAVTACPTDGGSLGNSTLAVLAATMAPGTWAQISAANQNAVLGAGTVSGTMIHYCNSMPWNPISKAIEVLAMDHNYGSLRYGRYLESSNQFSLITNDVGLGSATQHGYDHVNVNPTTGDLYYRQYSVNSGTIKCFRRKAVPRALRRCRRLPAQTGRSRLPSGRAGGRVRFPAAGATGCRAR